MRERIALKDGWNFYKNMVSGCDAIAPDGELITLPHTWNAEDGQDGGNDYYRGTCWYLREIVRPETEDGGQVYLEITGAAMTAEVFVNGEKMCRHEGGYSTFRVNITDALAEEKYVRNILAVSVDNSENETVYPQKADFTFYGGLYREVNLITVPASHFALDYCGTPGIRVTPKLSEDLHSAEVELTAWAECAEGKKVHFTIEGVGAADAEVKDGRAEAVIPISEVHLWDGVDDPYLYTAKAVLEDGLDQVSARFGCRNFEMDASRGFLLNGREYPLRGVSRHQDRKGAGNALTPGMHREDLAIIREMGANTIRLAHYQHAQEFYDLCDEQGLAVWAEIPYITLHMPGGRANTLSQMEELVVQNYNHPCIVCWGLSNEITAAPAGNMEDLLENHRLLNDLCHQLDKTRPTTMANVFMLETDSRLLEIPDISSYNLYFGWYLGSLEQNDSFFDEYHEKYPDRVIGFSEYGADANPAFQSSRPEQGDYTETYQCVYHEHILKMIEERPYLWATHVWNMFDFAADGRDEGGKHGENQKGLVTFDRKLKKDAFYLYKAYWSREPFAHVCGRRYVDRAEDVTEIKVYSNQPCVTLFVDGKRQEEKEGSRIFTFQVPITGEHEIRAYAGPKSLPAWDVSAAEAQGESGISEDGKLSSTIFVRKVDAPNQDYVFGTSGSVTNWFDRESIDPAYFSVMDKISDLQQHPVAGQILGRMMAQGAAARGDVAESVKDNPQLQRMLGRMTLQAMLKQAGDVITPEQVKELNAALQKIKK